MGNVLILLPKYFYVYMNIVTPRKSFEPPLSNLRKYFDPPAYLAPPFIWNSRVVFEKETRILPAKKKLLNTW